MSNITVADLSAKHIGQKVIIHDGDENSYVGVIQDLSFPRADHRTYADAFDPLAGVEVEFARARIMFPLSAEVEIRP